MYLCVCVCVCMCAYNIILRYNIIKVPTDYAIILLIHLYTHTKSAEQILFSRQRVYT